MALDDIFQALEEQADKEIVTILQDARDQAAVIAELADEEAQVVRLQRLEQAEKAVRSQASQSVNAAKLEAKKKVAAVKEKAVGAAYDEAMGMLAGVRSGAAYSATFRALAEEALKGMSGEIDVLVDPADAELAKSTFSELGVDVTVKPEISTSGGLVVSTSGGRIQRRNTFEDRLEKVQQSAQSDVAEILFS